MKNFFFDTSALFKRYQPEKGTLKVNEIISDKNSNLFISNLSIIEVISNLKRIYEIDHITTKSQFILQKSQFYKDIRDYEITIVDLTSDHILSAEGLILKRYMKPFDSLQLAIALSLPFSDLTLVCSDRRLCEIARVEELEALNPENYS